MMMHAEMVYAVPLWELAAVLMGAAVIGIVVLELAVRRLVPATLRRGHNDVAAAIFGIIGVTYAVLLAFVAMLAWEGFNRAESVTHAEAALVEDLAVVATSFDAPKLRDDIIGYAEQVITVEWPAQALGRSAETGSMLLSRIGRQVLAIEPRSAGEIDRHALLLQTLMRLRDTRAERVLAAQTTVPAIVWGVSMLGGIITVAFSCFLGAPSLRMQLGMATMLAVSGMLVFLVIIALSNPFRGDFHVLASPFEEALARIRLPGAGG